MSEIAERLALSNATVYRMIERGKIPALLIGRSLRVVGADFDALVMSHRKGSE